MTVNEPRYSSSAFDCCRPSQDSEDLESAPLIVTDEVDDDFVPTPWLWQDPSLSMCAFIGLASIIRLFISFPFPTTIPLFVGLALFISCWTVLSWCRLGWAVVMQRRGQKTTMRRCSSAFHTTLVLATLAVGWWFYLGISVPGEELPVLHRTDANVPERYFIGANLYENEDVLRSWFTELPKLVRYLGANNTYISIYESNSRDQTKPLLRQLHHNLDAMGVPHRILCEDDDNRWWPYPTSPERIQYLADARNRVLEPLQSDNATIRLPSYDSYTKVVFLNDIRFTYQSIVRLLATRLDGDASKPGEYDLACGMDFGASGLYDTWVARDICGTPMRAFWPFVRDKLSVQRIIEEKPLEVATCWNGVVAFPSGPYLYRPKTSVRKRGWKMVDDDTFPGSRHSPPIDLPLKFRSSSLDACDHSESFLFGYDLHRLYQTESRPPRIIMNPSVRVAYQDNWFRWHNGVLRMPIIRWWTKIWSRGVPLMFVNWLWEAGSTRRDHCTWSALQIGAPARCPILPGARQRGWGASG